MTVTMTWIYVMKQKKAQFKFMKKYLIIGVDGVAFRTLEKVWNELDNIPIIFRDTCVLTAGFPTTTHHILLPSLGVKEETYEPEAFFDPQQNKMYNNFCHEMWGDFIKYFNSNSSKHPEQLYKAHFGFVDSILRYLSTFFIRNYGVKQDFRRLKRFIRKNDDQQVVSAFLGICDALIHMQGDQGGEYILKNLDNFLAEDWGRELIIFSDHGMSQSKEKLHYVNLIKLLRRNGYISRSKLKGKKHCVCPFAGLLSYSGIYCDDEEKKRIADLLLNEDFCDVAMFRENNKIEILSSSFSATLKTEKGSFSYKITGENPFSIPDAGTISKEEYYQKTCQHPVYPDFFNRIYDAFFSVKFPPTLLISLKDGYYHGSFWLNLLCKTGLFSLKATHGNIRAQSANAFLLSTDEKIFGQGIRKDGKRFMKSTDFNLREYLSR
jgi:hypothetical protein